MFTPASHDVRWCLKPSSWGKNLNFPAGIRLHLMSPHYLDPSPVLDACGLKFIWVQKIVQLLQFSLYLTSKNMDIRLIFVQIYRSMLSIKLESSGEEEYNWLRTNQRSGLAPSCQCNIYPILLISSAFWEIAFCLSWSRPIIETFRRLKSKEGPIPDPESILGRGFVLYLDDILW